MTLSLRLGAGESLEYSFRGGFWKPGLRKESKDFRDLLIEPGDDNQLRSALLRRFREVSCSDRVSAIEGSCTPSPRSSPPGHCH